LSPQLVDRLIESGKARGLFFYTLLGGEPLLYPALDEILERHRDCFFQIITNGIRIDPQTARRWRELAHITPLISLDGLAESNDARRGPGTFDRVMQALGHLRREKLFFGIATTVYRDNFEEVLSDPFVKLAINTGAMYLWYYIFRPMGGSTSAELCLDVDQILSLRRRLLQLRRRHPILIIDTYWDAQGRAVCPAAVGLGYHIGPHGSIEPCPPLSVACERLTVDGDIFEVIRGSRFLRDFARFVHERTRGCVILECPGELARFLQEKQAQDFSGGRLIQNLSELPALPSHHQPAAEIPENSLIYRFLKSRLFFGLGAYG
jgi:MoaA/NifB/PqqE/SkfB family radical SAM enzyme